jgi:hypothetical protein
MKKEERYKITFSIGHALRNEFLVSFVSIGTSGGTLNFGNTSITPNVETQKIILSKLCQSYVFLNFKN